MDIDLDDCYLETLAKPLLNAEEEIALINAMHDGIDGAKDELIERNLKLVKGLAKSYAKMYKMDSDELLAEGTLGLIKAVEKFDLSENVRFSTYAVWWIKQTIRLYISKKDTVVLPINKRELIVAFNQKKREMSSQVSYAIDNYEIFEEMGLDNKSIIFLNSYLNQSQSHEHSDDFTKNSRFLANKESEDTYDFRDKEMLIEALGKLNAREKEIIERRFYGNETLESVGQSLGITRERVRQIEFKALKTLKRALKRTKQFEVRDELVEA